MKKIAQNSLLMLFMLILAFPAIAQQRKQVRHLPKYDLEPYHFGFILAMNIMDYSIKMKEDYQKVIYNEIPQEANINQASLYGLSSTNRPGFTVGIVGNLRLGNHFDLRFIPSLSFGSRQLEYSVKQDNKINTINYIQSFKPTFVEFPLHIKFRSKRDNNIAAYIIGGINYTLDLARQKESNNSYYLKTERNDLALEIGTGFDFYTKFFKFGVELKMNYGLGNILIKDESIYTSSIESLRNKVFQISFTFE